MSRQVQEPARLPSKLPSDPASRARIVKAVNSLRRLDHPTRMRLLQRLADKHGFILPAALSTVVITDLPAEF